ncbi:actin-binding protein WASF1-like [Sycon ciliatum]|uniref:actin-binding protein WASF1-like n=1 Tax=Sycon ciliatum TaxID=27933 RepID=UPI0031F6C818
MGLDGGLVVVAVDCIVGDGVGAANTQAPPPQEPTVEDQEEAVGPGPQAAPPQPKLPGALTKEPPTAGAKVATQTGPMSHHAYSPPPPPPATAEQAQSVSPDPQVV